MKNFVKPFISPSKFIYPSPHKKGPPPSPPPPPPPLKFDIIIAQVYGPAANIYKDIFEVSPTASQHELKEAYLRKSNEIQVKLVKLSNNNRKSILTSKERTIAKKKKLLLTQLTAISEAYQIVVDEQKKKEYDTSIGLKEHISEISFDCNAGEFPGDEQQNKAVEITSSVHNVDLNSRMKEYLKDKQTDADDWRVGTDDYDVITTKENSDNKDGITTEANPKKKVQFTLESLGAPSPPSSPEDVKKVSMVSPTGVTGFDNALSGSQDVTKTDSPGDTITPILRVRQDKEQLADVFASYLNLNNFINAKEYDDDEKMNNSDTFTVEEDDWSSDGTVKVSHCQSDLSNGFCVFAEEVMSKASFIADGLCQ